jgi:23S rRNA (adenine1618-N6)-methyltransferase
LYSLKLKPSEEALETTHIKEYTLDWRDEEAVKELTRSIILHGYQGKVRHYELPKGYLCPRVPQRKSYIQFIHQLFTQVEDRPVDHVLTGFDM